MPCTLYKWREQVVSNGNQMSRKYAPAIHHRWWVVEYHSKTMKNHVVLEIPVSSAIWRIVLWVQLDIWDSNQNDQTQGWKTALSSVYLQHSNVVWHSVRRQCPPPQAIQLTCLAYLIHPKTETEKPSDQAIVQSVVELYNECHNMFMTNHRTYP